MQCIFQCADFSNDEEELHYTPFIAAMLATRVQLQEEKVRAAFDAFDVSGSGFITAESLMEAFDGLSNQGGGPGGLTKEKAMDWIREVDYKGNGVVDYDGFLAALTGRHLWALPPVDQIGEEPTVRVFDENHEKIRAYSDTFTVGSNEKANSQIRQRLASAILDADHPEDLPRQAKSFAAPSVPLAKIHNVTVEVDDMYFS